MVLDAHVIAKGRAAAALAFASYAAVLTDGGAAAALAFGYLSAVLTDGGAAAAVTSASSAAVLIDARAPEFSAELLLTVVRALLAFSWHLRYLGRGCARGVSTQHAEGCCNAARGTQHPSACCASVSSRDSVQLVVVVTVEVFFSGSLEPQTPFFVFLSVPFPLRERGYWIGRRGV